MARNTWFTLGALGALVLAGGSLYAHEGHSHAKAGKSAALLCPVMKSPVKDRAKAPHVMVNNLPVYLCCSNCPGMLKKEPEKYLKSPVKDPVSGKPFKLTAKTPRLERDGALFLFSSQQTRAAFLKDPT